jgi:hypothetical protein
MVAPVCWRSTYEAECAHDADRILRQLQPNAEAAVTAADKRAVESLVARLSGAALGVCGTMDGTGWSGASSSGGFDPPPPWHGRTDSQRRSAARTLSFKGCSQAAEETLTSNGGGEDLERKLWLEQWVEGGGVQLAAVLPPEVRQMLGEVAHSGALGALRVTTERLGECSAPSRSFRVLASTPCHTRTPKAQWSLRWWRADVWVPQRQLWARALAQMQPTPHPVVPSTGGRSSSGLPWGCWCSAWSPAPTGRAQRRCRSCCRPRKNSWRQPSPYRGRRSRWRRGVRR